MENEFKENVKIEDTETHNQIETEVIKEDSSKENKPKRSYKRRLYLLLSTVILLFSFFFWGLYQSNWSLSHLQKIISEENYSCLISHKFLAPNCEHGKLCRVCELEMGEKTDHIWLDATCTEPKTCALCNRKEGKKLGHLTGFGKCDRCGGESLELLLEFNEIIEQWGKAVDIFEEAVDYIGYARSSYYMTSYYMITVNSNLRDVRKCIKNAIDICGSHSEFKVLKTCLRDAYNSIDDYYADTSEVLDAVDECIECLKRVGDEASRLARETSQFDI